AAITILAQPKRGGLTNGEVAEQVGVARSTLYEWKKSETFQKEIKKEIVRNTSDRLTKVFESIIDNIIETGNEAAFRTLTQMQGLLTDKVEIETKSAEAKNDMEKMKAEIAQFRSSKASD